MTGAHRPKAFVIDPPWDADAGGGGKGANHHYALSGVDGIAYEYKIAPPWSDLGPALLWMWSTTLAHQAGDDQRLARILGFRPCAEWVWAKVDVVRAPGPWSTRHIDVGFTHPKRPGIGQWQMCEHEYLTLCRRGDVDVKLSPRPRSMIYAPRGAHSEKPARAWTQAIEPVTRAVLPLARIVEFNARKRRPGTSAYGRLDGEHAPLRFEVGEDL